MIFEKKFGLKFWSSSNLKILMFLNIYTRHLLESFPSLPGMLVKNLLYKLYIICYIADCIQ